MENIYYKIRLISAVSTSIQSRGAALLATEQAER